MAQKLPPQQQVAVPEIAGSSIAVAATASDTTTYENVRGVYVGGGGAGKVLVLLMNGTAVTFTAPITGQLYPFMPTKVMAATTATDIVLLF